MIVAFQNVHHVLFALAHLVRLLDAAAGRRIVAGNRQTQRRTVVQVELLLHQTLAE